MIFRLADTPDDAQLRELMRETIIPGHIRMIYAREPSFFAALRNTGDRSQVIVADDEGRIVGVGCRSIRNLHANGRPQSVGYLSGLRLSPVAQNGMTLARGYAYLRELHADNEAPAYLTTIIHGNDRAQEFLTSERAGLPSYIPMGNYLTYVFPVRKTPADHTPQEQLQILSGTEVPAKQLAAFLAQEGARRQYFPVCGLNGDGILGAIGLKNLSVARQHDEIVGTMAIWNQGEYKQHVIAGYSPLFNVLRPILNLALRLQGCHSLPQAGEQLRYGTVALVCIRHDDPAVFRSLLRHTLARASSEGLHQLALGMHERDPLCKSTSDYYRVIYRSRLYLVCWDGREFYESLDKTRIPYLELGTL